MNFWLTIVLLFLAAGFGALVMALACAAGKPAPVRMCTCGRPDQPGVEHRYNDEPCFIKGV